MIWDEENGLFDALGNGTEEDMDKLGGLEEKTTINLTKETAAMTNYLRVKREQPKKLIKTRMSQKKMWKT